MHLINASPQSELGAREAENWFAQFVDSRPREALQADGRIRAEDLPEDIGEVIDLADAISLQIWFGAWASELTNVTPAVPLIRPTPKAVPKGVWFAAAGVLGVATLGACIGLHTWMNTQIKWHTDQIATVKKPAEQIKDIRKEIDAQEKALGDIEASTGSLREDLRRCRGAFESHQERIARLLASLAETGPSEFVVQAIETTGEGIKVTGICIRPDQANQLAMKMTDQLEPLGLRITIPRKQAKRMLLDGGPYEFELLIRDASESPPPVIDPYL